MAEKNDSMMNNAKEWAKEGVDIVKDTGDVIGDAAESAAKTVGRGAADLTNSVTDSVTGNKKK